MCFKPLGFVFFFAFFETSIQDNGGLETLQLVQVFVRHGEKNPQHVYPTDPYNDEKYWPGGWSQLTDRGVSEATELGVFLRKRYGGLISKNYDQYETYVLSSDTERSIRSALANLAGFYAPGLGIPSATNPTGNWSPVPVRTANKERTSLFGGDNCPNYQTAVDDFMRNSDLVKSINEKNKGMYDYINRHSGLNITILGKEFVDFHDALQLEDGMNYPLPSWTLPVYNSERVLHLIALNFRLVAFTPQFQRFLSGPLLHLVQNNINAKTGFGENTTSVTPSEFPFMHDYRRKMIMFSGHDSNMASLMTTLGVYEDIRPPFASALLLELHKDTNTGNYYLELWFRNDTSREPYFLELQPDSTEDNNLRMSVADFLRRIRPFVITPGEWYKECNSVGNRLLREVFTNGSDGNGITQFLMGTFFGVAIMILVTTVTTYFSAKKKEGYIPL